MPRIRALKHDLFLNETLADLGPHHMLLFAGLWLVADREGRLEDRPRKIGAQVFPYWQKINIDKILNDLNESKFILRYAIKDESYIQIVSWEKHQRPHHTEKPSVIPHPKRRRKNRELTVNSPLKDGEKKDSHGLMGNGVLGIGNGKAEGDETIAICIPLVDGSEFPVREKLVKEWEKSYPAVDVSQALNEIRSWNLSNPKLQKTRGGILRHINGWLAKEQNKPSRTSNSHRSRLAASAIGENTFRLGVDGFSPEEMKEAEQRKQEMLAEHEKKVAAKHKPVAEEAQDEEIPF